MRYVVCVLCALLLIGLPVCPQDASAQTMTQVVGPNGKVMMVAGNDPFSGKSPAKPGESNGKKPKKESSDGEKKEGENKGEKKPEESPEPKVIRRDQAGDGQADPDELKATVGEDGRVAFQFRNQPWEDLIEWLADISEQPLDWLELPGDRVNLRSPGRYTVEQTRDLFNRYLLARGYTLLELDGGLTVAKTENINPAIVPRVDVIKLRSMLPYSFARVSLDVGWLSAEKLAEELKPMISANGKLTALTTTNRIEAMDAVTNLQQVAELLEYERNNASREALAPEFKLRYLPAEEAKLMLEQFLGVEKKKEGPMTPQQMQMMQQMQRQNAGKGAPAPKKDDVSIVANVRQNSVLIRAPIDRVTIAFEFLTRVDVPRNTMASLADVQSRLDVIRLETLDPEKLIEIVTEMNVLEPTTRVRVDKDNGALIVSGSPADRFIIKSVVERLDGTGRSFHVLQLRHLPPTEVAKSIEFLMGQKDEDKEKNNRRSYYSYYGYGNNDEDDKEEDEFRVAANSRSRQIMLWADENEMEEVRSLLIKLGEMPPPEGSNRTIRVIDASATPETLEYLERLRRQWSHMSPNPIELPDAAVFREQQEAENTTDGDASSSEDKQDDVKPSAPIKRITDKGDVAKATFSPRASRSTVMQLTVAQSPEEIPTSGEEQSSGDDLGLADNESSDANKADVNSVQDFDRMFRRSGNSQSKNSDGEDDADRTARSGASPIRVELDQDGNLVIVSQDTKALDQLEQLMLQVTPPKRPYHTFEIKNASVFMVYTNLKEYFDEDEDGDSTESDFFRWYWGDGEEEEEEDPGLGRDDELRFVYDPDTKKIVVRGATPKQLTTIRELIKEWDVAPPEDTSKNRYIDLVSLKYGRAEKIADTVKEALRDLLSSNDKAFRQGGGQKGNGEKQSSGNDKSGSGLVDSKNGNDAGADDLSFKGKLSLGIDTQGNTLLVSAEGDSLLQLVTDMIGKLDEAARPSGEVQVLQIGGGLGGDAIESALRSFGASVTASEKTAPANAEKSPEKAAEAANQ